MQCNHIESKPFSALSIGDHLYSPEGLFCEKTDATHTVALETDSAFKAGDIVEILPEEIVEYIPKADNVHDKGNCPDCA